MSVRYLLVALACLLGTRGGVVAQTPGSCAPGVATAILDAADVLAPLSTSGVLAGFGEYVVPAGSGHSPVYALTPSLGGRVGGDIRVAGGLYTAEFWPGPLGTDAALPAGGCSPFDRIWTVSQLDLWVYGQTGVPTADLAEWPVGLGAPAIDAAGQPVVSADRTRVVDLAAGELPVISGRQTAFWVLNDVGNEHTRTMSAPLGVEMQVLAVVPDGAVLAQTTAYRYRIVNRSARAIEDFRSMVFADFDLGEALNDYVGSDSTRQMAFAYNASETDAAYGVPPAVGVDLLNGAESAPLVFKNGGTTYGEPGLADAFYCTMQGLWRDCTPIREGGRGNGPGGATTAWGFYGDPIAGAFWSMENTDGAGTNAAPQDQYAVVSAGARTVVPGAYVDLTFAVLFAQGTDRLDSIVRLRDVGDAAQDAFDSGALLASGAPASPAAVGAPALVSPAVDEAILNGPVTLTWAAIPGATRYRVQVSPDPLFASATTTDVRTTTLADLRYPVDGNIRTLYWRVRAYGMDAVGPYSATRSFRTGSDYTRMEFVGSGAGIVETARPDGGVCAGEPDDVGCAQYGGNTVWRDGDASGNYYVSAQIPDYLYNASRYVGALYPGGAAEIRFTAAGGYAFSPGLPARIVAVPFEIWNLGDIGAPADDVRMIPQVTRSGDVFTWADLFPRIENNPAVGQTPLSTTNAISFFQPKPGGSYAAFEADAIAFGGPGAVYDPALDNDTEVGANPTTGDACATQGFYVDFCYRNDRLGSGAAGSTYVSPVSSIVFVDLARDGTTPAAGTMIRFQVASPRFVTEQPLPASALASLGAPYPNPTRTGARVPFATDADGPVRIALVDLLGRTVAILVVDVVSAGVHEVFVPPGVAPGVYTVVLDVPGAARSARRLTVVR